MDRTDSKQSIKTFWRTRHRHAWGFLCPLCRTPRRISFRAQPGGVRHSFQMGLTSAVFTLLMWKFFGWKGIFSFIPFWTLFEIVYRCRMRTLLGCSRCGFDPYLFRVDTKRARNEVEAHWRKKFADKGIPYPQPHVPYLQPQSQKFQLTHPQATAGNGPSAEIRS